MKTLSGGLAGLAASLTVMIFVFWGMAIWTEDPRWGHTALMFFLAAILSAVGSYVTAVAAE